MIVFDLDLLDPAVDVVGAWCEYECLGALEVRLERVRGGAGFRYAIADAPPAESSAQFAALAAHLAANSTRSSFLH